MVAFCVCLLALLEITYRPSPQAGTGYSASGGVSAYNGYASINAHWVDTTDSDNLRASGVTGTETASSGKIGNTTHSDSKNDTTY